MLLTGPRTTGSGFRNLPQDGQKRATSAGRCQSFIIGIFGHAAAAPEQAPPKHDPMYVQSAWLSKKAVCGTLVQEHSATGPVNALETIERGLQTTLGA